MCENPELEPCWFIAQWYVVWVSGAKSGWLPPPPALPPRPSASQVCARLPSDQTNSSSSELYECLMNEPWGRAQTDRRVSSASILRFLPLSTSQRRRPWKRCSSQTLQTSATSERRWAWNEVFRFDPSWFGFPAVAKSDCDLCFQKSGRDGK